MTRSGGVSRESFNIATETRGESKNRTGEPPTTWVSDADERRSGMARGLVARGRYGATGERRRDASDRNLTRGGRRICPRVTRGRRIRGPGDEGGPARHAAGHTARDRMRARALRRAPRRRTDAGRRTSRSGSAASTASASRTIGPNRQARPDERPVVRMSAANRGSAPSVPAGNGHSLARVGRDPLKRIDGTMMSLDFLFRKSGR